MDILVMLRSAPVFQAGALRVPMHINVAPAD